MYVKGKAKLTSPFWFYQACSNRIVHQINQVMSKTIIHKDVKQGNSLSISSSYHLMSA